MPETIDLFGYPIFWRSDFWEQFLIFFLLTMRGLGLGLLVSIPIGIVLSRIPKLATPVISVLALVQTIPSLAFLGFCISLLNIVEGATIAITCAVVYSVFPIVLNTFTGISQVDAKLKDAARGMGMTDLQVLWKVELPLAMPVIMAGIRTGAVYAVGMITICAIVGAGGLGGYVTTGISRGDVALTLYGIIAILIFTTVVLAVMAGLAHFAKTNGSQGLIVCSVLIVVMAVYAVGDPLVRSVLSESARQRAGVGGDLQSATLYETWLKSDDFWRQTGLFLSLTIRGLGIALLFGIPCGLALTRFSRLATPVISILGLVQTVPSLALLGLCASAFALFGPSAAIFATVVYSLLPIVLNTYTGISQVDPRMKDAARGMGMTDLQVLWKVEIPLALPVIMAGVRTAATYSIIMVTIGVLVGARGLGGYIMQGMAREDNSLILLGVIPILTLSLLVFFSLSAIAWFSRVRATLGQIVGTALILLMAGFALAEPFLRPRSADIRIGCKNFPENLILGHILKIMLETHTNLTVELFPELGSNFAYKSLQSAQIDMYPEYTGTLLTAKDALNMKVPNEPNITIQDVVDQRVNTMKLIVPKGEGSITTLVRHEMKHTHNAILLEPFGLNNGYAISVPTTLAKKRNLKSIGDLRAHPDLTIVVAEEFIERPDGWIGMKRIYDLRNKTPRPVLPTFMYKKLKQGQVDVVIGFATDWQQGVYDINVLADTKGYFPKYLAAPLVRKPILNKHPEIRAVLNRLQGRIDDATIMKLNYAVIKDGRKAEDVAREFLQRAGLLQPQSESAAQSSLGRRRAGQPRRHAQLQTAR